jgi:hypothetical protein
MLEFSDALKNIVLGLLERVHLSQLFLLGVGVDPLDLFQHLLSERVVGEDG